MLLSHFIFNFALEYTINEVLVNKEGLGLNGTHELMVCTGFVNLFREKIRHHKERNRSFVRCW
jgi:hypothetical protein